MLTGLAAGCGDNLAAPIPPDAPPGPAAPQWTLDVGTLKLRVSEAPWQMTSFDASGNPILNEHDGTSPGPTGTIGLHLGPAREGSGEAALPQLAPGESGIPATRDTDWVRATELIESNYEGQIWVGKVATTDVNVTLEVRARPDADGIISISVTPSSTEVQAIGVAFETQADERFVGFGERSNAVE